MTKCREISRIACRCRWGRGMLLDDRHSRVSSSIKVYQNTKFCHTWSGENDEQLCQRWSICETILVCNPGHKWKCLPFLCYVYDLNCGAFDSWKWSTMLHWMQGWTVEYAPVTKGHLIRTLSMTVSSKKSHYLRI